MNPGNDQWILCQKKTEKTTRLMKVHMKLSPAHPNKSESGQLSRSTIDLQKMQVAEKQNKW